MSCFWDSFLIQVTELFTAQKGELEQCKTELDVVEKELEDTQKNLETTKVLLVEEEFVSSALEATEEKLHGTATKVLQFTLLVPPPALS